MGSDPIGAAYRRALSRGMAALTLLGAASAGAVVDRPQRLSVRVVPDRIVLGGEGPQEARIEVAVPPSSARAGVAGVRVEATAGSVQDLRAVGTGRFVARLMAPVERFPQIAVVTVADVGAASLGVAPALEVAVVAFAARIELRGESEPKALLRVDIGGKRFGPVTADAGGRFAVPVVVDPGEGWATTTATDSLGNASRSRINLYLPAVQRLQAYVFPEVLIADGEDQGWVFVTSLGPTGAPQPAVVEARPSRGRTARAERVAPGLTRFAYRAPAERGPGEDEIAVSVPGWGAPTLLRVPIAAGRPERLSVSMAPAPTVADGATPTRLTVRVQDRAGNPAEGHRVVLDLGDTVLATSETTPGTYESELPASRVAVRATGRVRLEPVAHRCPRPRAIAAEAGLAVMDRRGVPCVGELVAIDAAGTELWRRMLAAGNERRGVTAPTPMPNLLLAFTDAAGERHVVEPVGGAGSPGLTPVLETSVDVVWRVPVEAELRLILIERGARASRVRLNAGGIDDPRQRIRLEASGAVVEVAGETRGALDLTVRPARPGAVDVVATDIVTGVSAWLRIE